MSYKEERDKASKLCGPWFNGTRRAFRKGADWSLKSAEVSGLVQVIDAYLKDNSCNCNLCFVCDFQKAKNTYEAALKS